MPTILIVDDDPSLRSALGTILQQAGFSIDIANDGALALASVHAKAPDIIVSDNMMPVMGGIELWRSLATHPVYSRIPFLLLSAIDMFPSDVRPTAFLRKPYSPTKLLALMADWTHH
ncbi:response regulator [Paraburkholderia sp. HD33-4]|uniref:response regulator n=1 Tax=Paraburkholderia sp. HD33-4 TaxID=2883242 RepID=UPI003FA349EC